MLKSLGAIPLRGKMSCRLHALSHLGQVRLRMCLALMLVKKPPLGEQALQAYIYQRTGERA